MTQTQIKEMMERAYKEAAANRGKLRKTIMSQKEQDLYGAMYQNEKKGK